MKSVAKIKPISFLWATLWGVGIGSIVGYLAVRFDWNFGYAVAIGMVAGCAYLIVLFQGLTEIYLFPGFERFSRGKRLTYQMLSSFLAHVIGWIIPVWITGVAVGFEFFRLEVLLFLSMFIIAIVIIHSVSLLIRFYRELADKEVIEERLKTLAAQAELKVLQAQINPHFLFNSLNTIASLIDIDSQKAERSVEQLSDIFRYALSATDKDFVTLREELGFIDTYLEIEKARFGDRLKVARHIAPGITNTPVPILILQPLVENSIKHGSAGNGEMIIEISGYIDGDSVKVEIKDEGKGIPDEVRTGNHTHGMGLRNVNERLKKVYGERYALELKQNKPTGTIAVVTIPTEKR